VCVIDKWERALKTFTHTHTLKSWEGRCKVKMLLVGEGNEI